MKKFLATLVLVFSLTGVYVSADARDASRQQGVQAMGFISGSLNPLVLQRGRRRWRWRRSSGNGNWNRGRWNRGRRDNDWNRGRRRGRRWHGRRDDNR